MKINFLNIKSFTLKRKLKKIFNYTMQQCKIESDHLSVNVGFVSESAIQKLNKENRKVDKVTDVLSFPFFNLVVGESVDYSLFEKEQDPKTHLTEFGDIMICENVAKRQAQQYGHSFIREVCFLSTHGLLHLLGYDHLDEKSEKEMNDFCESILNKFRIKR